MLTLAPVQNAERICDNYHNTNFEESLFVYINKKNKV
jgi:hypothetical protein